MLPIASVALLGCPAAARAADPIVIGQVAPFTGSQAVTGLAIHAGVQLCVDAVNAQGGVRGRPLKLVTRDDAQKPDATVRLTRELIASDAPVALIGTVGTDNLEALAKDGVLDQTHVSMVGAVSGAASLAKAPNLYPVKARYRDEIARLFSQISFLGIKRVALLYQDDSLGRDVLAGADAAARRYGITLLVRAGYQRNTTAVAKAVAEIAKVQPQVVFLGATTAAAIEFVKEYAAVKGTGTLYGMSIIDGDALLKALGPKRARGYAFSVVLPLATQTQVAVVREYLQLRKASTDTHLSARSIEGFIACKALVKVLDSTPDPTPAKLSAALKRAKSIDVGNFVLDFADKERGVSNYVDFAMFGADGRVVQ
ncbi:MAG: ABC transporter substrate-binding protein [Burkholderiales bacterium]|nr:ABC transporter substrate-binding protein [Burkholderiales bacterium]MDE1927026.1 ABC transporter substrate-binding protein [Burkholderiales bacterium]MDE2157744.1 ABC transporter substrate-binding protein [Burkholderiales bacterium]MDE2503941.1 ABC transporter substrate-binding protein [Burkholderiales bacterium]